VPDDPRSFQASLLDFYKESYTAELENKEKFNGRLSFNLAILTILANICVSFLNDAPAYHPTSGVVLFYAAFGAATVLGLASIFFFFRALGIPFGHPYAYIATTTEIEEYIQALHDYNEEVAETDKIDVESEFQTHLMDQYAKSAAVNARSNRRKMQSLTRALVASVLSLIFLLLSAAPFFAIKFSSGKPPQRIEIATPIKIEDAKVNR
jgi:hypothetical protein